MDEAEILSNKVAIMTNGEFQMYQPLSHIEKKYGQGLQITIKIRDPTQSEILGMIVLSNKEKGDKIKYR